MKGGERDTWAESAEKAAAIAAETTSPALVQTCVQKTKVRACVLPFPGTVDCSATNGSAAQLEKPPRLFDLTDLQKDCNRRFSWSADYTLKYHSFHALKSYRQSEQNHG
jgi:DNA topoisomerase IA